MTKVRKFNVWFNTTMIAFHIAVIAFGTPNIITSIAMAMHWTFLGWQLGMLKRKESPEPIELLSFDTYRPEIHSWAKDDEYFRRYMSPDLIRIRGVMSGMRLSETIVFIGGKQNGK